MKNLLCYRDFRIRVYIFLAFVALVVACLALDVREMNRPDNQGQFAKRVTVELPNHTLLTFSGYAVCDRSKLFHKDDLVYVEFSQNSLPYAVRHFNDVYSKNGQLFVKTISCGDYPAILIKAKVINLNFPK